MNKNEELQKLILEGLAYFLQTLNPHFGDHTERKEWFDRVNKLLNKEISWR